MIQLIQIKGVSGIYYYITNESIIPSKVWRLLSMFDKNDFKEHYFEHKHKNFIY